MNWIRIATGITRDPSVIALSEAVGVSVPTTTGHVVGVLTSLPEGCPTGDLSGVSDATLEQWAMWRGRKGVFAAAFRAQLCDEQGVMRSWAKYNGSKLRELATDRERKKAAREAAKVQRMSGGNLPDNAGPSGPVRPLRDETRRDEQHYLQASLLPIDPICTTRDRVAPKKPKPVRGDGPKFPHFSRDLCTEMHTLWVSKFGAIGYPLFRKEFGPLFTLAEAERPSSAPTDKDLRDALKSYVDLFTMGDGATFASAKRAAGCLSAIANVRREYANEPERRLEAVMRIIHGRNKAAA